MPQLDLTFKALADPNRRAILARLAKGDARVGELVEPLAITWPAVTKHLRVLQRAGLVEQVREGNTRRCRLVARPMRDARDWINRYEVFWSGQLDALREYFEKTGRRT
jgi:DNA-binding transcriptional ArsR family regulator